MTTNNFLAIAFCCITVLSACSNPKHSTKSSGSTVATMNDTTRAATEKLTDSKWKLIELTGKPVADSINGIIPFIILRLNDSIYNANGGCKWAWWKICALDEKTLRMTV